MYEQRSHVCFSMFLGGTAPLKEDMWHVTDYYENIRNKVKNLDKNLGDCHKIEGLPSRMCNTPMKVRYETKNIAAPCQLLGSSGRC
jgi:hypothetical protein